MNTPREVVEALREARTSAAILQGDHLDAVLADLDALKERERRDAQLDARLQQMPAARDDSTPANDEADATRGCPFDEQLHDTEGRS